jgi:solute carrier family 20 (sodium-dependent phosphate transporter)
MFIQGPLLFKRPVIAEVDHANVTNYAVVQEDDFEEEQSSTRSLESITNSNSADENEKRLATTEATQTNYEEMVAQGESKLNEKLMKKCGPFGWAMRTIRDNPMGPGQIYEVQNMKILAKRIPAIIVCGALYGLHYDIHAAQTGIESTPEGKWMERVYAAAEKYPNEVEHTYSFVQILTACTAFFAHGANDVGNPVGPWVVIYSAWNTGSAAASKAPVPVWQLYVLSATVSLGLITYGYNIMKGKCNSIQRILALANLNV